MRIGAWLWLASTVCYFVAEAVSASAFAGYDYATMYVSALGEPGASPLAWVINAAFVVQGVLLPVGGWLLTRGAPPLPFRICLVAIVIGNVLIATMHSGAGTVWHGVGAALALVGGNAAALAGARALRPPVAWPGYATTATVLGGLGLLCLIPVVLLVEPVGVWERGSVYAIYAWQTLTAVLVLRSR